MNINVKNHIMGASKTSYYHFLGLIIIVAAIPGIVIISPNFENGLSIFSLFSFILTTSLLYMAMHDIGRIDKKPYNWNRYPLKGLLLGFLGFLPYFIVELGLIYVARKYISPNAVPYSGVNMKGYVTEILYLPYFWIMRLINSKDKIPSVTYLTSVIPLIYMSAVSGFGYIMGFKDKLIIKNAPKGKWFKYLVYGREKLKNEKRAKANRKL